MAPGDGNEVLVRFNGDGQKLQGTIQDMIKALQQFSKAIDDTSKKAADPSPGGGKGGIDEYHFSLNRLSESVLKSTGAFGGLMLGLNSTIGVVNEIVGVIGGAVSGFLNFAETVGGVVVDALRMAGQEVANLTEQVFELNKSTEQNTGSWRFIYGGGGDQGQGVMQNLMAWTSQFSMQVPYTRQDLMGAITALGRTGMSADTVKQYMSTIADLGALNPQRTLTQAAWSVQGAMSGYSRMLKYDYGINPDELQNFGFDPDNPQATLLPALKAYLTARHMIGAAQYAAHNTFWGAESSFVDRLQNFGLQVGGTALNGSITKGSMFDVLKTNLTGLSDWWDKHSQQIAQIANFFQNILGGAFKTATSFMQGFMQGFEASGFEKFFEFMARNLGDLLNSKDLQSGASSLGALVGKGLGALLTDIGIGLSQLFNGLKDSGAGGSMLDSLKRLVNWLGDPKTRADISQAAYLIGTVLGGAIVTVTNALIMQAGAGQPATRDARNAARHPAGDRRHRRRRAAGGSHRAALAAPGDRQFRAGGGHRDRCGQAGVAVAE